MSEIKGCEVVSVLIHLLACYEGKQRFSYLTSGGQPDKLQEAYERASINDIVWVLDTIIFGIIAGNSPEGEFAEPYNEFVEEWAEERGQALNRELGIGVPTVTRSVDEVNDTYVGYLREWLPNIEIFFDNLELEGHMY